MADYVSNPDLGWKRLQGDLSRWFLNETPEGRFAAMQTHDDGMHCACGTPRRRRLLATSLQSDLARAVQERGRYEPRRSAPVGTPRTDAALLTASRTARAATSAAAIPHVVTLTGRAPVARQ